MATLIGSAGNDILAGTDLADSLNGLAGADKLTGGKDNDRYYVDNAGDVVTELANQGSDDRVLASISIAALANNVENLWLLGGADLDATGNALENALFGTLGANTLNGGAGNDEILSYGGADHILGGAGDDAAAGGDGADQLEGGDGNDDFEGGDGSDTLHGDAGNDILNGGDQDDVLAGGTGNDRLDGGSGADDMTGGAGNDTYTIDDTKDVVRELANGGTDEIRTKLDNINLTATGSDAFGAFDLNNVENLTLLGSGNLNATGNAADNVITGNTGQNILNGGAGNDILDGGKGGDQMTGGKGNDTFGVDDAADRIFENALEGKDLVVASTDYDLSVNAGQEIENLTLTGAAVAGTGNNLDNVITGNAGDNELSGGAGKDTLAGGDGDDEYTLGSLDTTDKIVEAANQGTDTVFAAFNYALGANLENLILTGSASTGTGNTLNNTILGNSGIGNTMDGGAGDDKLVGSGQIDTLLGGSGNDSLNGGLGIDTLTGGAGNDTYNLLDFSDTITEAANGGADTVVANFDISLLVFGQVQQFQNVENLTLTGSADGSILASAADNVITGNDGKNDVTASLGNDTLFGMGGADTLDGGDGNDAIDGGSGIDHLIGGKGNDTYFVDDALDVVDEDKTAGTDTVKTKVDYDLFAQGIGDVETLLFVGTGDFHGKGNAIANTITGGAGKDVLNGGDGNDTLDGGAGNDSLIGDGGNDVMQGGLGDDSYFVEEAGDKVTELAKQGTDTVASALLTYILGANLENLSMIQDAGAIGGTGNSLDNQIKGNTDANLLDGAAGDDKIYGDDGADTLKSGSGDDYLQGDKGTDSLDGGAGNDTLFDQFGGDTLAGGAGNDFYILKFQNSIVTELAKGGTDEVDADFSVSIAAYANVENLLLLNAGGNIDGTGNGLDNVITGNDGKNTMSGGDGNDTLDGGLGADVLDGGDGNDTYIIGAGDTIKDSTGDDTIQSSGSFDLGTTPDIENLTLTGPGGPNGTGNGLNNIIIGTSDLNTLDGGTGDDTLVGGKGADVYKVDSAGDKVIENANEGTTDEVITSLASYVLGANIEWLQLTASGASGTGNALGNQVFADAGDNTLNGMAGDDGLFGGANDDTLDGGTGNDRLDGGTGDDTMTGGAGNDTFVVDSVSDVVVELAGGGVDTAQTDNLFIDLRVAPFLNVENVTLTGTLNLPESGNDASNILTGNTGDNGLTGFAGNDTLNGLSGKDVLDGGDGNDALDGGDDNDQLLGGNGNDILDGGASNDEMIGGGGDDTYYVDDINDRVLDYPDGGKDKVYASVDFDLSASIGREIEFLILTGTGNINGTGSEFANAITGNAGDNTLDGGAGNDTLAGGAGNDFYLVDSIGDKVTELANAGDDDTVLTTLTSYTLGANLEGLGFDDTVVHGATGTGNTLANQITGTDGKDKLDGGAGDDHLFGNDNDDNLTGGTGDDILDGNFGNDAMTGGAGNDRYEVDSIGDTVTEAANGGIDGIRTGLASFDLSLHGANVENLQLVGAGTGIGNDLGNLMQGSAFSDGLDGGKGNDVLEGGLGTDALTGGAGNDLFLYRLGNNADLAQLGGDTIADFEHGKDRIDLRDLFEDFNIQSRDAVADGFLKVEASGADTLVKFDSNGGGDGFVTLVTLQDTTAATVADIVF